MTKTLRIIIAIWFIIASNTILHAQTSSIKDMVAAVTARADSAAIEKLYLHTDKPFYTIGDTLRFKAYLFNAAYLRASAKSSIIYIEIANDQNQVIIRKMVATVVGLGWGNLILNEKLFPEGNYTLRAYTNWMRNYDEQYLFQKQFSISRPTENTLFIKSKINVKDNAGKRQAEVTLRLTKTDQLPVILQGFQLKISESNKTRYQNKVQTLVDGSISFNYDIPDKTDVNNLLITLQPLSKTNNTELYQIPFTTNQANNTDLQFLPEGGSLVAGLPAHVAFKTLSRDGRGINISGTVYNSHQQEIANFQATHSGMGTFNFIPQPGEIYTAKIKLADGVYSKLYALPAVKPSGFVLAVNNSFDADSVIVTITPTPDLKQSGSVYYLIAQSRGIGCYGEAIKVTAFPRKIRLSKKLFPMGIARFTLLNQEHQPLNERIIFIQRENDLNVNLILNKKTYSLRDSASVAIQVTDRDSSQPAAMSFSVAITDDNQVKTDSLTNSSLLSTILLTSDIKGYVEDPGYYFPQTFTPAIWQNLDNLLLAQGWVNYNWAVSFEPFTPGPYLAELEFAIKGQVTNMFNKPVEKSRVVLLSKKPTLVMDTVTNKLGIFTFNHIYPTDTPAYVIQARNKRGKSFNVGIEVAEFKPPFIHPLNIKTIPWYVNTDSSLVKTTKNILTYTNEHEKLAGKNMLKEVKIKGKRVINGSRNLNRDGGSDLSIDQEEMEKAGKITLGDLLAKRIQGFHLGSGKFPYLYFIHDQFLHFVIDGVNIDFAYPGFGTDPTDYLRYVKDYLDGYTAEDIKGIELMKSSKYVSAYFSHFLNPLDNITFDHAFIEITTYSGSGPFLKKTPGVYIYKPIAFAAQKEFYSPKYTIKTDRSLLDTQSTIYWSPNIITDKGRAQFSFYTADKPSNYTLLMDGTDMNGNVIGIRQKIEVK
ncbi:MAG: hypothetical protein AAGC65_20350 [Mucilaginibacter sp.]|uniref:hypothetical protein n=1 Tax=Mucilaginibacter sp. TaxID=1882438 RepID=UPI0031A7BC4A